MASCKVYFSFIKIKFVLKRTLRLKCFFSSKCSGVFAANFTNSRIVKVSNEMVGVI